MSKKKLIIDLSEEDFEMIQRQKKQLQIKTNTQHYKTVCSIADHVLEFIEKGYSFKVVKDDREIEIRFLNIK